MANPTAVLSTNKGTYAPGETIVLTVTYGDTDRYTLVINVAITDSAGNTGTATTSVVIDQGTVVVTSTPAKTWTLTSNTGTVATFTTTA
jgi:hypothetical protein